jgi:hypothetical protein
MTSMTSTARVRARSRAPYIRKLLLFFLIFIFSKFLCDCWFGLIQVNRNLPSEWLAVHGGRSYGPVPRGKRLPGPAVPILHYCIIPHKKFNILYFFLIFIFSEFRRVSAVHQTKGNS